LGDRSLLNSVISVLPPSDPHLREEKGSLDTIDFHEENNVLSGCDFLTTLFKFFRNGYIIPLLDHVVLVAPGQQ
jgi:hypothetical protein